MPKKVCPDARKASRWLCFSDARLFPHYKVRGNLRYGMAKSMVDQFDKLRWRFLGIEPLLDRLQAVVPEAKTARSDWAGFADGTRIAVAG